MDWQEAQVPMALLPAGTANILAKELGPWDIPDASRLISAGSIRRVAWASPLPRMVSHSADLPPKAAYFLSVAGAGPDGAIVERRAAAN